MLARSAKRRGFSRRPGGGWLLWDRAVPGVALEPRHYPARTGARPSASTRASSTKATSATTASGSLYLLGRAELRHRKTDQARRIKSYKGDKATCGTCPIRKARTDADARALVRHMDEEARQTARELARTPAFAESRSKRKKVEVPFAHLKRRLGLMRLRPRGLAGANEEFLLVAAVQNLKRLSKLVPA